MQFSVLHGIDVHYVVHVGKICSHFEMLVIHSEP